MALGIKNGTDQAQAQITLAELGVSALKLYPAATLKT